MLVRVGNDLVDAVAIIDQNGNVAGSSESRPANVFVTAYAASKILSATPKTLCSLTITNSKVTGQFIQLHNSATLPADTAVPEWTGYIGPLTTLMLEWSKGRYFSTGCVVCNSSTGPTKTIGSADCWFDGQVI